MRKTNQVTYALSLEIRHEQVSELQEFIYLDGIAVKIVVKFG
jgi:hypothetical protein